MMSLVFLLSGLGLYIAMVAFAAGYTHPLQRQPGVEGSFKELALVALAVLWPLGLLALIFKPIVWAIGRSFHWIYQQGEQAGRLPVTPVIPQAIVVAEVAKPSPPPKPVMTADSLTERLTEEYQRAIQRFGR